MAETIRRITAWALRLTFVRAFLHYSEHRGAQLADSITYRTLFSVFAGVLLGFSIAALWLSGNPQAWQALIAGVDAVVPGLVGDRGLIDVTDIQAPAGLTVAGVLSLVGLVGAGIGAIGSMRSALRTLGDRVSDDVFWLWVLLRNLGLAVAIAVALVVSSAVTFLGTAFIGVVRDWAGIGPGILADGATRVLAILVVLVLDSAIVAVLFVTLSGVRASRRAIITGALWGGIGLTILQQLSGLFVGGASSNPLLASFASLIALLLWFNLSAQVILIASSYIVVRVEEESDRVRARHGASTFAQRRVRRAEDAVRVATEELEHARAAEQEERTALRGDARA